METEVSENNARADLANVARRGGWWGAALGLWSAVWLLVFPAANSALIARWPGIEASAVNLHNLSRTAGELIGFEAPILMTVPLAFVLGFALIGVVGSVLLAVLGFDRQRRVREAMLWPLGPVVRAVWLWPLWLGLFLLGSWFNDGDTVAAAKPFSVVFFAWLLIVAFSAFHRPIAASDRGERWWIPSWPGLGPAAAAALLCALVMALGALPELLPHWSRVLLWVPLAVAKLLLVIAVGVALLDRRGLSALWSRRAVWLRLRVVLAWVMLQLRWMLVAIWLAVPVVSVYLLHWWTILAAEAYCAEQSLAMPAILAMVSSIAEFFGKYGVAILMVLVAPYGLLSQARLLASVVEPQPPMSEPESAPIQVQPMVLQ